MKYCPDPRARASFGPMLGFRMLRPSWAIASLTTLALTLWGASAAASTVAVTEIAGPIQDNISSAIENALRKSPDIEVVTLADWKRAALEGGLDPVRDRVQIAQRVGATRLMRAEVSRTTKRWVLTVEVTDGSGRPLKRWRAKSKKVRRLDVIVQKKLLQRLKSVLVDGSAPRQATAAAPSRSQSAKLTGPVRLGLLAVKGGRKTARRLSRALQKYPNIRLVPTEQVERTAADLGANLDTTQGRMEVARALRLRAWLAVRSRGRRQRYASSGTIFSGDNGKRIDKVEGRGKTESAALRGMVALLIEPLSRTEAPAPDAPSARVQAAPPPAPRRATRRRRTRQERAPVAMERAPTPDVAIERDAPPVPAGRSRAPLSVALGVSFQNRDYSYNDDAFESLRPYELAGAPAIAADVRWYPAAHFVDGFARHIGVDFRGRYLVGVSSEDADGNEFGTSSFDLVGGLRGRFPLGSHEVGLALGFGQHQFSVDVPDDGPALPSVTYTYLRIGADGRVGLPADLHIYGGFAWRQVFSAGDLDSDEWFPRASTGGLDAQLGIGWVFYQGLELRLGGELTRYFFSLNAEPGDARVAGGALDQYITGTIDVVWTLDG